MARMSSTTTIYRRSGVPESYPAVLAPDKTDEWSVACMHPSALPTPSPPGVHPHNGRVPTLCLHRSTGAVRTRRPRRPRLRHADYADVTVCRSAQPLHGCKQLIAEAVPEDQLCHKVSSRASWLAGLSMKGFPRFSHLVMVQMATRSRCVGVARWI